MLPATCWVPPHQRGLGETDSGFGNGSTTGPVPGRSSRRTTERDQPAPNPQSGGTVSQHVFRAIFRSQHLRVPRVGVLPLTADVVARIFGVRTQAAGRSSTRYGKSTTASCCASPVRASSHGYAKFAFSRIEVCVNRLKDLGLNTGHRAPPALRTTLIAIDRLAVLRPSPQRLHVDFLFERVAQPIAAGARLPASRSTTRACPPDGSPLRGPQIAGWLPPRMHRAVLDVCDHLAYRSRLRYDVRNSSPAPDPRRRYCYRLTAKGSIQWPRCVVPSGSAGH